VAPCSGSVRLPVSGPRKVSILPAFTIAAYNLGRVGSFRAKMAQDQVRPKTRAKRRQCLCPMRFVRAEGCRQSSTAVHRAKSRRTFKRQDDRLDLRCGDLLCQFRLTNQVRQSRLTGMDIEELRVNLSSDDPAIGLRASLALHRLAERVEANHVASAREKGWSWQQIGDALGVTRQSVHTKYSKESS
jgi:hypothetical protein